MSTRPEGCKVRRSGTGRVDEDRRRPRKRVCASYLPAWSTVYGCNSRHVATCFAGRCSGGRAPPIPLREAILRGQPAAGTSLAGRRVSARAAQGDPAFDTNLVAVFFAALPCTAWANRTFAFGAYSLRSGFGRYVSSPRKSPFMRPNLRKRELRGPELARALVTGPTPPRTGVPRYFARLHDPTFPAAPQPQILGLAFRAPKRVDVRFPGSPDACASAVGIAGPFARGNGTSRHADADADADGDKTLFQRGIRVALCPPRSPRRRHAPRAERPHRLRRGRLRQHSPGRRVPARLQAVHRRPERLEPDEADAEHQLPVHGAEPYALAGRYPCSRSTGRAGTAASWATTSSSPTSWETRRSRRSPRASSRRGRRTVRSSPSSATERSGRAISRAAPSARSRSTDTRLHGHRTAPASPSRPTAGSGSRTSPPEMETRITFLEAPNDILDEDPDWSPDGTTIVFERAQQTIGGGAYQSDIYVVGSSGGDTQRLTGTLRSGCGPRVVARRHEDRLFESP